MKKFALAAVILLALALVSCGGKTSGGEPVKKDSITIAIGTDPATFDVLFAGSMLEGQIGNNIYDNLLFFDDNGNVLPYLAERYEISNDGLTYTFWLKKGVKFHNGEEFTADDVAFAIEYGVNTPNVGEVCAAISKKEILDDYTIRVTLSEPYASFLNEFCGDLFGIYNRKAVTEAIASSGSYGAVPIGTGSYKFVSRTAGSEIKLEAFADHFQGPPPVRYLTYRIVPDDFTAGVALENGEVDFIWTLGAATAETLKGKSNVTVSAIPSNRVNYLGLNTTKAPFDNVKLRQAVNYAIDRDAIIDIIYEGNAEVKDYMAFPWMAGFAEPSVRYTYDPEKAVALAREAGVSKDKPIAVTLILTSANQRFGETLQQYLSEIGITLKLDLMEFNAWMADFYGGNYQMGAGGFYMVYKDANLLTMLLHTSGIEVNNSPRYSNPKVDEFFDAGRREVDPAKRSVFYKQAFDIVQADAPYVVWSNPANIRAYNKNLKIAAWYANNILVRDMSWN
jgi:peptide/nickel transport system substrate-binding protein